jgi:hypothetical protein
MMTSTASPLDKLTAKLTAFNDFAELVGSHPSYRPTILPRDAEHVALADAFDRAMKAQGSDRRAWRGTAEAAPSTVLSVRLTSMCPHRKPSNQCCGYAEWLQVIHTVNGALPAEERDARGFGAPLEMYDWWTGELWAEEYLEYRVLLHKRDGDLLTNYVQAKTPRAAAALKAAVKAVTGLTVDDNGQAV